VEGSHAVISAEMVRKYRESPSVAHAVEAHHYDVEPQTVEAVLVIAADAVSASRPGGRGESLERYIKRLEALEEIAGTKQGGDGRHQAGRRPCQRDAGRPRARRHGQAGGGRRRRGSAAQPRDRARDRGPARVSGPD